MYCSLRGARKLILRLKKFSFTVWIWIPEKSGIQITDKKTGFQIIFTCVPWTENKTKNLVLKYLLGPNTRLHKRQVFNWFRIWVSGFWVPHCMGLTPSSQERLTKMLFLFVYKKFVCLFATRTRLQSSTAVS